MIVFASAWWVEVGIDIISKPGRFHVAAIQHKKLKFCILAKRPTWGRKKISPRVGLEKG